MQVAMDTVLTLESPVATSILNFAFEVVVSELLLCNLVVFHSSFLNFLIFLHFLFHDTFVILGGYLRQQDWRTGR